MVQKEARLHFIESIIWIISIFLTINCVCIAFVSFFIKEQNVIHFSGYLFLLVLFWWGIYIWIRYSKGHANILFLEHFYALLAFLILFLWIVPVNYLTGLDEWVFLLLYPFLIAPLLNQRAYMGWSLAYFLVFLVSISTIDDATFFQISHKLFYLLLFILIGWQIGRVLNNLFLRFESFRIQRHKERMFQLFNTFIPLIEKRHHIDRDEIRQMSIMIEKMTKYFPEEDIQKWEVDLASLVHYVIRIYIPDYFWEKKEPLTPNERQFVNEHVQFGADLLANLSEFSRVQEGILYHHERLDGKGYPTHTKEVPIFAQIIGIVDEFIELTTPRHYREDVYTIVEAVEQLNGLSNIAFDEKVIIALNEVIKEVYHTEV